MVRREPRVPMGPFPSNPAVMLVHDTSEVSPARRFQHWRDVICRNFALGEPSTPDQRGFTGRLQINHLGSVRVCRVSAGRHAWLRSAEHIRNAPHDDMLLSLVLHGEAQVSEVGRRVRQRAGEFILCDPNRPLVYAQTSERLDLLHLAVPRPALLERVPKAEHFRTTAFGLGSPAGALTAQTMRHALDNDLSASPTTAHLVGESLLDLAAATIEWHFSGNTPTSTTERDLLGQIKRYVLAHLADDALDLTSLARQHGVAPRTLNRLFAAEGTTPMRWVREQRLQACREALEQDGRQPIRIIAARHGFSDMPHFSRVFKARFGVVPSVVSRARPRG